MAGLSVLTHTHTLPRFCCSSSHADLLLSTTVLKAHSLLPIFASFLLFVHPQKNRAVFPHTGPPLSIHSSQGRIVFHAQDFPVFYPRIFPLRIYKWFGCIIPSRTDSWVLRCRFRSLPGWGNYNLFPSMVYVCFPGDFIAQGRVEFSPRCEPSPLMHFGAVNFPRK